VYQSFYNLTGKPFRLSPDPAFFFPSRGHKRALAYLRYGLHQNEGFVVITGSPGTGKTTLAQILLEEMGEKNVVVAHLTTTQLEADDMLRMVAASFGLRYESLDKAALLKTIESFLLARSREGKRALLVIDEAQNLPARSLEELRMLSNLQIGDKALLQTFLLGQIQFRNMLDNPDLEQLRQRVIANFHLSPLAADESQRYIESRLKHVNWKNDPHFAEVAFEKIHEYTEGVPRRINMLCDRILLFACMEDTHNITGEVVDLVKKELEQEVSGGSVKTQARTLTSPEPSSESAAPGSTKEPAYNAKASVNATSQLAEELKNVTQKSAPAFKGEDITASAAKPKPEQSAEPEVASAEPKAKSTTAKNAFETGKNRQRAEPTLPENFDSDDEDFIEITEDFISAFDKNMSISDDANEASEKSLLNTSARLREKQPSASDKSDKNKQKQDNKQSQSAVKQEQESKDKPVVAKQPEREEIDQDVLGNTVKHKKPAVTDAEDDDIAINLTPEPPPQISERDLFRVIPGGKDNHATAPTKEPKVVTPPAAQVAPTSEDVVLRRILRLVLAFHRSPSSFPGLDDPTQPLPEGVSELLELAVSDDQVLTKVSPAAVMGISPVMLRAAVRFFVRRTLFASKGDYYRILGLPPNATVADVERHYDLLMRLLRQDKQPGAAECVDRVGRAYEELMRLDNVPVKSEDAYDQPEDKAAAVLEALENPELTIDFGREFKPKEQATPVSAYLGAGKDSYIPDPRIARRRIHLLGQAAILGIGALVVVLGIFITQLEPSDSVESKPVSNTPANIADADDASRQEQRRLDLSFNDGSSASTGTSASGSSDASSQTVESPTAETKEDEPVSPVVRETKNRDEPPVKVVAKSESSTSDTGQTISLPTKSAKAVESVPVQEFHPEPATASSSTKTATKTVQASSESTSGGTRSVLQQAAPVAVVGVAAASASKSSVTSPVANEAATTSKFTSIPVEEKTAVTTSQSAQVVPVLPKNAISSGASSVQSLPGELASSPESSTVAKMEPVPVVSQQITEISQPMLDKLLKDFSSSFKSGDLDNLMGMFTAASRTNSQTTKQGIEEEYRKVFSNTATRSMTLVASTWNNEGRFARGTGQYSANLRPNGGSPVSVKGEYTMQLQLDGDNLKISRFYLSEDLPVSRLKAQTGPSQTDLNALLSGFTEAYENGDINRLMNLFADNAQTNDQNTLAGIRKDHVDLFNATEARQMFLKDVKWDVKGNTATGKGNFEVLVQSKGQSSFATVKGKITLEAVKTTDGVKLSKFFHQVQQ